MLETIKTTFRNGAFVPHAPVEFAENEEVEIVVNKMKTVSPDSRTDANLTDEEKEELLKQLVENMQSNPIPMNAPRFTREDLYDRS